MWTSVVLCFISVILVTSAVPSLKYLRRGPDDCEPVIVAHRGASGYIPEHTLGAYALSITLGADYVEPDLVMTKDGHLIARHENKLDITTDVAERPEFADRYRTLSLFGIEMSGWFSEDFTLAEIKTLKSIEAFPKTRPGNTRLNGAFEVPTFQEIIDLVKGMEISENRTIGIYPELKYGSYFQHIGLPMEKAVVDVFHKNGYIGRDAPAYIQSFEINNLKELKKITDIRLLQLFGRKGGQPLDQMLLGTSITYGDMATPEGLVEVAKYADAVGPDKSYIIPRDAQNRLDKPTSFVNDAHAAGLKVHPYTFRAENTYLPAEYRSEDPSESAIGNLYGELEAFMATGVDGFFVDQPDYLYRIRKQCF
ncbi:glycerophosphodiester phosphodiesterase, periplasmic-like [Leptidea sinapis]|uniref:glycerophosphodiester phosphodiesterase n=1 Tax=Leptidea sinapis TaxID=189913 RepID=A0A5E4PS43_9NEOP|nr:glycerophosphodiester phosphodiesterase, periplasmic-like [Leptidea sinapis]VVC87924.1 unnamed protein product [Leptidea sinapis]